MWWKPTLRFLKVKNKQTNKTAKHTHFKTKLKKKQHRVSKNFNSRIGLYMNMWTLYEHDSYFFKDLTTEAPNYLYEDNKHSLLKSVTMDDFFFISISWTCIYWKTMTHLPVCPSESSPFLYLQANINL